MPDSPPQLPGYLEPDERLSASARIHRAHDRLRDRKVAVKWSSNRTQMRALRHEWSMLHRLSGAVTAVPLDFLAADDSNGYLTTAWVEGSGFSDFWPKASPRHRLEAVWSALAGLNHIHRAGYRHGDVRPNNLLLEDRPEGVRAYWLDLEHALSLGSLSAGGLTVPGWNPESFGRGADTDLRALGTMLQEAGTSANGDQASGIVREFVRRLCDNYDLAGMPNAWAAMHSLAQLCREAEVDGFEPRLLSVQPAPVSNPAAMRQWGEILDGLGSGTAPALIQVSGRPHTGKTTFLNSAAMTCGVDARVSVLNLLPPVPVVSTDTAAHVVGWLADATATVMLFVTEEQWSHLRPVLEGDALAHLRVVVELNGDSPEWQDAPDPWHNVKWAFPPFGLKEWYRWISAAI